PNVCAWDFLGFGIWDLGFGIWDLLESQPESQLHRARRVREVRVVLRLAVERAELVGDIRAVVGPIEDVEQFQDAVYRPAAAKRDPLLQADVEAVHGIADKAVARHNGTIRAEALRDRLESLPEASQVFAVNGRQPLAGAIEVGPAQLEATAHLPDAVEHGAVPLVGHRERVVTAEILRDRERHLFQAAEGRRIAIPES